jgi:hypothetical protein
MRNKILFMPYLQLFLIGVTVTQLVACTTLLPTGETRAGKGWGSFEEAKIAFEKIEPYQSTRMTIHEMGLDPFVNPSVSLLSYSDLVQRFGNVRGVQNDQLDQGLIRCMEGGKRCSGYQLAKRNIKQNRIGNMWLDMFNFKRETETIGWSFSGLILFVDDQVVMTMYSGQPRINEYSVQKNPLGPFQSLPERGVQSAIRL